MIIKKIFFKCFLLLLIILSSFSCQKENSFPLKVGLYIEDDGKFFRIQKNVNNFTFETITDSIPFFSPNISFLRISNMPVYYTGRRGLALNEDLFDFKLEKLKSRPTISFNAEYQKRRWNRRRQRWEYYNVERYYEKYDFSDFISTIRSAFVKFVQFDPWLDFYYAGKTIYFDFETYVDRPGVIQIKINKPLEPGIYKVNDSFMFAVGDKKRIAQQILDNHLEIYEKYNFRPGLALIYKRLMEKYPSENLEKFLVENFLEPFERKVMDKISLDRYFDISEERIVLLTKKENDNFNIFYFDLEEDTVVRLTNTEEDELYPTFAPNGKKVAFVRKSKKKYALCFMDSLKGRVYVLNDDVGEITSPIFSNDGNVIVFGKIFRTRNKRLNVQQIFAFDLVNDTLFQLTNIPAVNKDYVFSPDGNSIAFVSQYRFKSMIHLMNLKENNIKVISSENVYARNPVFSPDGKYIYYDGEHSGRRDIFKYSIANKTDSIVVDINFKNYHPVFSGSGEKLFFFSEVEGERAIFMLDNKRNAFKRLTYAELNEEILEYIKPIQNLLIAIVRHKTGPDDFEDRVVLFDLNEKFSTKRSMLIRKLNDIVKANSREKEYAPRNEKDILKTAEKFIKQAFQKDQEDRIEAREYMISDFDLSFQKDKPYNRIIEILDAKVKIDDWSYQDYSRIDEVRTIVHGNLVDYTGLRKKYRAYLDLQLTDKGWKVAGIKNLGIWF